MRHQKRFLKIAGIVFAVVILLFVAGSLLFSFVAKKKIQEANIGKFQLTSEKTETTLLRRQITLTGARLKDGAAMTATVSSVTISGISFFKLLLDNQLSVKKFSVNAPVVHVFKTEKSGRTSSSRTDSSANERTIRVKQIEIPDMQFLYFGEDTSGVDTVFSTSLDIKVKNFSTDTTSVQYVSSGFGFDQFSILVDQGQLKVKNGLYSLTFDQINFDTNNPDLIISKLNFVSPYSRYEIGRQTGVETDWYDINIDSIALTDIKVSSLMKDTTLIIKKTIISNMNADIFRDKHLPFPDKPDTKLPSELINSVPLGLHNDTLLIHNTNIQYEERGENAETEGKLTFNNLQATLLNVSNIDSLKKGATTLSATTEVMNTTTLDVDFTFTERGADDPSQVTGTLEPTKFAIFNPMLQPYLGVEIQSGQILRLAFNFGYNNEQSNGDIIFEYQDLDFIIRNTDNDSEELILTFLADNIVVRDKNIEGQSSYRKGTISNTRSKKKSIFNFWWKSLQSGLKSVAAI